MLKKLKRILFSRILHDEKRTEFYRFCDSGGESLRLDYPLGKESVVVDVGGYLGDFASEIFCKYACRIDVFEPVSTYAESISKRFSNNDKVTVHQAGLAGSSREEKIRIDGLGSSVFGVVGRNIKTENIRMLSVLDYLDEFLDIEVDLLKLNIEGGEYELLQAILDSESLIQRIIHLQIQFHDFVPNAKVMRDEIRARLSKTHVLMWDFPFIWESWRLKKEYE